MLKIISAAALVAAVAGLTAIGANAKSRSSDNDGISVNGTSKTGVAVEAMAAAPTGLVLANGTTVTLR